MPKEGKSRIHSKKIAHPNSRKAVKLARAAHRDEKLQRRKAERTYLLQIKVGEKIRWFFENIDQDKTQYTVPEVCELVERYLGRFDEELRRIEEQNSIKGRQGRAHASREDAMKSVIERETELYNTCGMELPDLTSAKTLRLFKDWNCDVATLKLIKMKKFHSNGSKQEVKGNNVLREEAENPVKQRSEE